MVDRLSKHDEKSYEMTDKLTVARHIEYTIDEIYNTIKFYEEGAGMNEVNRDIANRNFGVKQAIKIIEEMYEDLIYCDNEYTWESPTVIAKNKMKNFVEIYESLKEHEDSRELQELKVEFKKTFGFDIDSLDLSEPKN